MCFPPSTWITYCNGIAAAANSACKSGGTTTRSNTGKAPGTCGLGKDGEQDHPLQQQPQILVVQFKILSAVLWRERSLSLNQNHLVMFQN